MSQPKNPVEESLGEVNQREMLQIPDSEQEMPECEQKTASLARVNREALDAALENCSEEIEGLE